MLNSTESKENSEEDLYYFESDHLALRGNQDYSEVLKTLFVLTAQREKAIKDYSAVVELKKKYLENPSEAVEKLKNGIDLGVPPLQSLPEIPQINFAKYDVTIPEDCLKQAYSNEHFSEHKEQRPYKTEKKHSNPNSTHNKPWSLEEQKKLEALLRVYPPEAVESKRFEKIAAALGTRTTKQVTSRVQKYFLKLRQSGLPIPGRIPKNDKYHKKSIHKHQRHNHYLWKPTTFFPHLCTPVTMNDMDDTPVPVTSLSESNDKPSKFNYLLPSQYAECKPPSPSLEASVSQKSENEMKLNLLKRIRQEKVRESEDLSRQFVHIDFRCDYCNECPIIGGRWHCTDCLVDSIDFCTDCLISQLLENIHPIRHRFILYHNETETSMSDSGSNSYSGLDNSSKDGESSDSDIDDINIPAITIENRPHGTDNNSHSSHKELSEINIVY